VPSGNSHVVGCAPEGIFMLRSKSNMYRNKLHRCFLDKRFNPEQAKEVAR
jgi:hypothetical protein